MLKEMTKPTTKASPKPDTPVSQVPPVDTERNVEIPDSVAGDDKKTQIWENASEDERFLAAELCKLDVRANASLMEHYLRFADAWHAHFKKEKHGRYKRDMEFVKKGAAMSPYSLSHVYKILQTVNIYSREKYEKLVAAAEKNGVTVYWYSLRVIAEMLGKSEYRGARAKVEQELVRTQLSEPKLREVIARHMPESAGPAAEQDPAKVGRSQLKALVSTFRKATNKFVDWQDALEQFELSENPKQVAATRNEAEEAIQLLDQMTQFINENRPVLEMLLENAAAAPEERDEQEEETVRIAKRVKEKTETNQRPRQPDSSRSFQRGFSLSKEFADDGRPVKMDRRDDDDFSGLDGPGDEDEFDALYDDSPEFGDDDLPDIFDEYGGIPDFPPG